MHDTEPGRVTTLDGEFLVAFERLAHLVCLPAVTPVTVAVDGVVLSVGRTQRYATTAQRLALVVRDGGCVFPGCGAPATWCDAHHVEHWEDAGATNIDNLIGHRYDPTPEPAAAR